VPNEIYATARRELLAVISPRAADRVLDDALAAVEVTPEAVTARQMRALITGPVQAELRAILPTPGLNHVLRAILTDLRAMSSSTAPAAPVAEAQIYAPAPLAESDLPAAELERIALEFARLEHVIGVAVLRDGDVAFARGAGFDPQRAAIIVPVAAKLLARRGSWRSYTLTHDRGQCFIIPVGRDFIVLVGRSEFNLGAVLTVLATLEEDL
jgi:hypothetical protein